MERIAAPPTERRWPVFFCSALVFPIPIMMLGGYIASYFMPPSDYGSYIALGLMTMQLVLSWGFVIWGWKRGERPRLLAVFGPMLSIWIVKNMLFG
jgi:hypothetical protein